MPKLYQTVSMPTPSLLSAAEALHEVFGNGRRVPEGWNNGLSIEDARLAKAVMGLCLKKWGWLNAWYQPKLRDPRGLPARTQIALSIGLAQLAWLPGVAVYAAVAESVELLADKKRGFPAHKGLANAILRTASKDRGALAAELGSMPAGLNRTPFSGLLLKAALQESHSAENAEALWGKWQCPPTTAFVALEGPPPDCMAQDDGFPWAWRLRPNADFPMEWLQSGRGMVQDLSSQALMKFSLGSERKKPAHILDLCAAPGGKTSSLSLMFPGAKITAVEQNAKRAGKLKENLAARCIEAEVIVAESMAWLKGCDRKFDLILLDAPCSASGTIRKNPDLNWIFDPAELGRLVHVQHGLLEAAMGGLSPGGLLIYSVCSWFPEEGIGHLQRLLDAHPQMSPAPIWQDGGAPSHIFRPDPLAWDGEGFQGFAVGQ